MQEIYLAIDGDNVGHRLEYLMLINDRETLTKFSQTFQRSMIWLENKLINDLYAEIVFSGGDNLLACLKTISAEALEILRSEFFERANSTLSIGLGNSPRQAYFALKLAKTSGKNCICKFQEMSND